MRFRFLAGFFVIAALTVSSAAEEKSSMAAAMVPTFDMIAKSFVGLAAAMPPDKYDFKPQNGEFRSVRNFGEQVKHVACANYAFFSEIEKKEPPANCETGGPGNAATKDELLQYLRDSFEYGKRVIAATTAENALDPVSGPYGGPSTRLGITTLAVWHASDHYGQLVVYLRMNGVIPPASRSAR